MACGSEVKCIARQAGLYWGRASLLLTRAIVCSFVLPDKLDFTRRMNIYECVCNQGASVGLGLDAVGGLVFIILVSVGWFVLQRTRENGSAPRVWPELLISIKFCLERILKCEEEREGQNKSKAMRRGD